MESDKRLKSEVAASLSQSYLPLEEWNMGCICLYGFLSYRSELVFMGYLWREAMKKIVFCGVGIPPGV